MEELNNQLKEQKYVVDEPERVISLNGSQQGQNPVRHDEQAAMDESARILSSDKRARSVGIWKDLPNAQRGANAPQETFEAMQGLRKGGRVAVWDIETLGTASHNRLANPTAIDFFSITELAIKTGKYTGNVGKPFDFAKSVEESILVAPDRKTIERLQGAIDTLKMNGFKGSVLNADLQRSLAALTQYSDPKNFKKGEEVTRISGHASTRIGTGSILARQSSIQAMQQGLLNLQKYGTSFENALLFLDKVVGKKATFAGHNVHGFDRPAMLDSIEQKIAKGNVSGHIASAITRLQNNFKASQIDTLELAKAVTVSPYTKFGANMKLGGIYASSGKEVTNAHLGIYDVKMNADILNQISGMDETKKIMSNLKENVVKTGEIFFSKQGLQKYAPSSYQGINGKHDGIFRFENGKYVPVKMGDAGALYKNQSYRVAKQYSNLELGGRKQHGVLLENQETGLFHFLAREKKSDLAKIFQEQMDHIPKEEWRQMSLLRERDSARRSFEKMFSYMEGNGTNGMKTAYRAIDLYDAEKARLEKTGLKGTTLHKKAVDASLERLNANQKPEYQYGRKRVEESLMMRGRLEEERPFWEKAIANIDDMSRIYKTGDQRKDFQNAAMVEAKKRLESSFGDVKEEYGFDGARRFELNTATGTRQLDAARPETFRNAIGGLINPKAPKRVKERQLREFAKDMQERGLFTEERAAAFMQRAMSDLNEFGTLSVNLKAEEGEALRASVLFGEKYKTSVEGTRLGELPPSHHRKQFMTGLKSSHGVEFASKIIDQATSQARSYVRHEKVLQHSILPTGSAAARLTQHEKSLEQLYQVSGLNPFRDKKPVGKMITDLVQSYGNQGFSVDIRYLKEKDKMLFFFGDRRDAKSLVNMSFTELMQSDHVANFEIPLQKADGTVRVGGQDYNNRFFGTARKDGSIAVESFTERFLRRMGNQAKNIRERRDEDAMIGVKPKNMLDAQKTLDLSRNNMTGGLISRHYSGYTGDDIDRGESKLSQMARQKASTHLDMKGFAERWHQDQEYLGLVKGTSEIAAKAQKEGGLFFDHMNREARQLFDSTITAWAQNKGVNAHYHGVNDKQAAAGIRATDDVRGFYVAGVMSPTARENLDKAANYRPLDGEYSRAEMRKAGMSEKEIERRLKFATTDKFAAARQLVDGGQEVSHINMRMAMVNDFQLTSARKEGIERLDQEERTLKATQHTMSKDEYARRMKEIADARSYLKKEGLLTVHDGMGLMREDLMSAFDFKRESTIALKETATLKPALQAMIEERTGQAFDPTKTLDSNAFSRGISFKDLEQAGLVDKNGRVTVADVMKDDVAKGDGHFKRWHNDWEITGYDAEKNRLVVTEKDKMTSSGKMVSLDGDRNTYRSVPKKAIQAMFGDDIDGIMYQTEIGKQMGSTFINSKVQLYEQELLAQLNGEQKAGPMIEQFMKKNNFTVQDLSREEVQTKALEEIYKPQLKKLGFTEDMVTTRDGRTIFDHSKAAQMDLDASGVGTHARVLDFMKTMDKGTGADFSRRPYEVAQKQLARHDIYTTESIGQKVRIGQKEIQILESKYGKDSQYAAYIRKTLDAQPGSPDARAVQQEFGKFLSNVRSGPKAGDLIFDFSGGVASDDLTNARATSTGAIAIDGKGLKDLPDPISAGKLAGRFGIEDYAGTIMDTSKVKFRSGKEQKMVAEYLAETNGQSFLKLPQMFEGQAEYVPWMDISRLRKDEIGESPMFRDIEKKQLALYRHVKDYESLGLQVNVNDPTSPEYKNAQAVIEKKAAELQDKIQRGVREVEESVIQYGTNSRKSGMQASLDSTKLHNSGQFRAQTVNPFDMYEATVDANGKRSWREAVGGPYKENSMYISRTQMKEMIAGSKSEKNIIDILLTAEEKKAIDAEYQTKRAKYTKEFTTANGAEIDPEGFKEYEKRMRRAERFNKERAKKKYMGHEPFFPSEEAIERHIGMKDAYLDRALDKITKGSERGEIFGLLNRNPSTSDRTMQAVKMVIDPALDGQDDRGAIVTPGTLIKMNGDTDGDTVYAQMSHYSSDNARALHEETRKLHERDRISTQPYGQNVVEKEAKIMEENMFGFMLSQAKERHGDAYMTTKELESMIGVEGVQGIRGQATTMVNNALMSSKGSITVGALTAAGFNENQAQSFFRFKNTALDDMLSQEARLGKTLLGSIDNIRQNMRDLHEIYSSKAHAMGHYGQGEEGLNLWNKRQEKVQLFGEVISQDLISSKKLDPITMMNEFRAKGVAESDLMNATAEELKLRRGHVAEVEKLLKTTVTKSDAEQLKQHLQALNLFTGDKEAMFNEASQELRNMNYATAPFQGMENASLRMRSEGLSNADQLREMLLSGNFHPTRQVKNVIDSLQGELRETAQRSMERYHKTVEQRIGSLSEIDAAHEAINFGNYREERSAADKIMKTGGETIAERAGRRVQSGIGKALESGTETLMRNGGLIGAAGVSFGAMWGLSALMRSGPTPEGMREEQEMASAAEVSPSSLLTSPTARVTPNAEAVNLRIEAKGNMNHNEVAGMVNSQIQAQTGVPLNMQMNVQDDRQAIDQQYLQQIVTQALGHGFAAK